jgi:hypothetical protein
MIRRHLIDRAVKKLTDVELQRLGESLDHAMSKPHYDIAELIPILVDGHHQIDSPSGRRIKSAIRELSSTELAWLADNIDKLLPK